MGAKAATGPETVIAKWRGEAMVVRVLLHYDIRAVDATVRRRVDRFLYGDRQTRKVDGRTKRYRYRASWRRSAAATWVNPWYSSPSTRRKKPSTSFAA